MRRQMSMKTSLFNSPPLCGYDIHTFARHLSGKKNIVIPAKAGTQKPGGGKRPRTLQPQFGKRTPASHAIPSPSNFWVPACAGMTVFLRFDVCRNANTTYAK